MSLPITHYLYLGFALFAVGLGGAVLRRSLIAALLGVELMLVATAVLASAYARMFLDPRGQIAAALIVLVALVELAIVVAIVARMINAARAEGSSPAEVAALLDDWPGVGGEG